MADFSPATWLKQPSRHRFRVPQIENSSTSLHFRGFGFEVQGSKFEVLSFDQHLQSAAATLNLEPKTRNLPYISSSKRRIIFLNCSILQD